MYLSSPLQAEQQEIREFRRQVDVFVKDLCVNEPFIAALESHASVAEPNTCVEEILGDPEFYSSVVFFLHHVRTRPPRKLLGVLGLSQRKCPKLDMQWMETLLTGCFHTHAKSFEAHKELFRRTLRDAKRVGIVERREVSLRSVTKIAKLLIRSASKLKSVDDIVRLENQSLGPDLRMVILTDFIRRADFPSDPADVKPVKKLGVVPIFEQIRRSDAGIHETGDSHGDFDRRALRFSGSPSSQCIRSGHRTGGYRVQTPGSRSAILRTDHPRGRQAEDGRPGHRPVQSGRNQRPGRDHLAARRGLGRPFRELADPGQLRRLVHALEPDAGPGHPHAGRPAGQDREHLAPRLPGRRLAAAQRGHGNAGRRFKSFVGVSFTKPRIESGLGRLGLGQPPYTAARMEHINAVMQRKACDRPKLISDWERALASAREADMAEQVVALGSRPAARFPLPQRDPGSALAGVLLGHRRVLVPDAIQRHSDARAPCSS